MHLHHAFGRRVAQCVVHLADGGDQLPRLGADAVVLALPNGKAGRTVDAFDAAGADLLAVETLPSLDEARVLAELLADGRTPAWVSFSCRDGAGSSSRSAS